MIVALALTLAACAPRPAPPAPTEPLPTDAHRAAEAEALARVPDPARGGPPLRDGASPLPPFYGVSRADNAYVGTATCSACHPTAAATWATTQHASALDTLRANASGANPSCLPCHVTGFGHPGGWAGNKSPVPLDHVGCEACHGPGGAHVAAGGAPGSAEPGSGEPGYGDLPASGAACVGCHTHDNSPEFRFEAYWPKIAHGGEG